MGGGDRPEPELSEADVDRLLRTPSPERILCVRSAMLRGRSDAEIHRISSIDPWFLAKLRRIVDAEQELLKGRQLRDLLAPELLELKQLGFSDRQIAWQTGSDELTVRRHRHGLGIRAVYKTVDTCAAEFASATPYHYSTYEKPLLTLQPDGSLDQQPNSTEVIRRSDRRKMMILGGGPNRI